MWSDLHEKMSQMETKCPQQQFGYVITIKCTVLPKWLTESQHMLSLPRRFWHHCKRAIVMEIPNPMVERKNHLLFFSCQHFGWWCPMPCAKQCHQTHFHDLSRQPRLFPPVISSGPSSLFMVSNKFSFKSNQIRHVKPYLAHLCGLALVLYLQVICFT